jgi:DNA invertase Pin-like site-specific DNA recombinase
MVVSHAGQVIGYVRVSTDDQELSAEAQRHRIQEWCWAQGLELVAIYEDVGVSGGAKLDNRPGILDALNALKPGMALVATKRDRLARDTMYAAMIERLAMREHAAVRTCDGAGDGDSPEDFILRGMLDLFATYERLLIKARTKTALAQKKRQGQRISRFAPYGYCFADDSTLVEAAAEQLVITAARQYAEAGLSLRQIAQRLATDGHLSRAGTTFTAKSVRTMVQDVAA